MSLLDNTICPLCRGSAIFFCSVNRKEPRVYFRCLGCWLIFLDRNRLPTADEEKKIYDLHQNSPSDSRYRAFLQRLFQPMQQRIAPGSYGLDFGSGPGPTLSVMFEEAGHKMEIYDPFYAADSRPLNQSYDFITISETVEHLHYPNRDLNRIWSILKPGGWIGIMTKRVDASLAHPSDFMQWHYIQCPTHVIFFSIETFEWLRSNWQATKFIIAGNDVILLKKS